MEKQNTKISVEDLTVEVAMLIKEEIVAEYSKEANSIWVHFLNGQKFRVSVEECNEERT